MQKSPATSGVCQGSVTGIAPFSALVNDLDNGTEFFCKFAGDTELEEAVDRPGGS